MDAPRIHPLVKGWRTTQATEDGTFFQPHRNVRKDSNTGKPVYVKVGFLGHVNWIHPESRYPEEWDNIWEEQRTKGVGSNKAADAHVKSLQWRDPYWRNPYVTSADKDILVPLWQLEDRVMLGIFNYNKKESVSGGIEIHETG